MARDVVAVEIAFRVIDLIMGCQFRLYNYETEWTVHFEVPLL